MRVRQTFRKSSEAWGERCKGEEKAAAEKKKGEEQSGGIFGWLADKAKAFFEGIKQAINAAMEAARAAVKFAIEGAQKLATAAIEAARQVIVGIIKLAGEALIAIGEVMLAAFPEMRERYRNAMKAIVRTAENAVNAIANNLKKGVQVALNLLGKGLDFALGLMEKGLMAAVDIASIAVQGAISTAKAAVEALGAFSVLAKDIASGPGQWLSNLGSGAQDGVRNHLWGAFQTATQEWFNQKVEEVLGLGTTVWKVLNQGGIKTAEVGKMAWDGIKSAIPPALIQILIEKVISMIVPAAGALLAIIQGLQAAWGTVSRVIQAFDRFMGFLKAVKTGQSGPQFGAALAAAGVVLIDFVSNWLLKRVRGAASKVAAKVKQIAKKIGRKLKAATKKLGGKFGKVKDKFKGKEKGDKGKGKEGDRKANKENKEDKDRKNKDKVEQAARELQPKVNALLGRGVSGIRLKAQLALWLVQYRLSRLYVQKEGADSFQIVAQVNPKANVLKGFSPTEREILRIVHKIGQEMVNSPEAIAAAQSLEQQRQQGAGTTPSNPLVTSSGAGNLGAIRDLRKFVKKRQLGSPEHFKIGNSVVAEGHEKKPPFNNPYITLGTNEVQIASGGSYPSIRDNLKNIQTDLKTSLPKLTDRDREGQIALALRTIAQGKPLPPYLAKYENSFAELNRLMSHVEGSRGNAAAVYNPMLLEMVGKQEMSFDEAFTGQADKRGLFPPSQQGAVKAMERVAEDSKVTEEELALNNKTAKLDKAKEQARRQIEFVKRWITMKMKQQDLNFKDSAQLEKYVKEEFEKDLRNSMKNFYNFSQF